MVKMLETVIATKAEEAEAERSGSEVIDDYIKVIYMHLFYLGINGTLERVLPSGVSTFLFFEGRVGMRILGGYEKCWKILRGCEKFPRNMGVGGTPNSTMQTIQIT